MWARIVELLTGIYLMASPWIYSGGGTVKDLVCGGLVILLSALSWRPKTGWAHYFTGGVALWMGSRRGCTSSGLVRRPRRMNSRWPSFC
jgi:hypothetical protein